MLGPHTAPSVQLCIRMRRSGRNYLKKNNFRELKRATPAVRVAMRCSSVSGALLGARMILIHGVKQHGEPLKMGSGGRGFKSAHSVPNA